MSKNWPTQSIKKFELNANLRNPSSVIQMLENLHTFSQSSISDRKLLPKAQSIPHNHLPTDEDVQVYVLNVETERKHAPFIEQLILYEEEVNLANLHLISLFKN